MWSSSQVTQGWSQAVDTREGRSQISYQGFMTHSHVVSTYLWCSYMLSLLSHTRLFQRSDVLHFIKALFNWGTSRQNCIQYLFFKCVLELCAITDKRNHLTQHVFLHGSWGKPRQTRAAQRLRTVGPRPESEPMSFFQWRNSCDRWSISVIRQLGLRISETTAGRAVAPKEQILVRGSTVSLK